MTAVPSEAPRTSPVVIRESRSEDYPTLVAINNASFPDYPETEEEWRYEDEHFDASKYTKARLVAVEPASDGVVGFAEFSHTPWAHDPGRYQAWVNVHPDWRRRGVGGVLYERVLQEMRERGATVLKASVKESMDVELAWVRRLGFQEVSRYWESRLDLGTFDPAQFAKHLKPLGDVRIVTLKDELAEDPGRLRALYEFENAVGPDVPRTDPFTPPTFEMFRDMIHGPWSFPEAFFLAKDGDVVVGQSDVGRSEADPNVLYTGFTAVRREYRGRGIAWALKLRALSLAKERGFKEVRTWNSTLNAPMLGINVALGFVRQPAWIQFDKALAGDP